MRWSSACGRRATGALRQGPSRPAALCSARRRRRTGSQQSVRRTRRPACPLPRSTVEGRESGLGTTRGGAAGAGGDRGVMIRGQGGVGGTQVGDARVRRAITHQQYRYIGDRRSAHRPRGAGRFPLATEHAQWWRCFQHPARKGGTTPAGGLGWPPSSRRGTFDRPVRTCRPGRHSPAHRRGRCRSLRSERSSRPVGSQS